jgi:predicted small lipoprotein YifL
MKITLSVLAASFALAGCGNKGALVLPPSPGAAAPKPAAAKVEPAKPAAPPADHNSAQPATSPQ